MKAEKRGNFRQELDHVAVKMTSQLDREVIQLTRSHSTREIAASITFDSRNSMEKVASLTKQKSIRNLPTLVFKISTTRQKET